MCLIWHLNTVLPYFNLQKKLHWTQCGFSLVAACAVQCSATVLKLNIHIVLFFSAFRYSTNGRADKDVESIVLPAESRYFFQCPVSSHHARYTWHHGGSSTSCSPKEQNCLFLIDSMGPEQEGTYKCSSEESGFTKVLAQYNIEMTNGATGRSSGPLVWVCLMVVLIKSLNC